MHESSNKRDVAEPHDLGCVEVEAFRFESAGAIPNNPDLPALILRGAIAPEAATPAVTALLRRNGWGGVWNWRVFDYDHFHPDAHEALAVAQGSARLRLGGEGGADVDVTAGDVLILPAGTGHRQIAASDDFTVCGAYPPGQEAPTILRRDDDGDAPARIAATPRPKTDPIYGADGPLMARWR